MEQVPLPLPPEPGQTRAVRTPTISLVPTSPLAAATQAYRDYLASSEFSKNTIRNFVCDISMMERFLGATTPIGRITATQTSGWAAELNRPERALSAKSISRRVCAMRHFFTWLHDSGSIPTNPAADVPCRRVYSPLPLILTDAECARLLELAAESVRTHLIVSLLLSTGMKKGELVALRLRDFDISDPTHPSVWIQRGHTSKHSDRLLRLPPEIVPVLRSYQQSAAPTDRLFDCTDRNIEYILKGLGNRLGSDKRVTAQILRDTYAARQLKAGLAIEEVLRRLGLAPVQWNADIRDKYLKLAAIPQREAHE